MSFRDDLLKVLGIKIPVAQIPAKPPVLGKIGMSRTSIPSGGMQCADALTFNGYGQPMITVARIIDGLYEVNSGRRVRIFLDYEAIACKDAIKSKKGFYVINNIKKHITKKIATGFWNETGEIYRNLGDSEFGYIKKQVSATPYDFYTTMDNSSDPVHASPEIIWNEYQRNTLYTDYAALDENEPLSVTDMQSLSSEKIEGQLFGSKPAYIGMNDDTKSEVKKEIALFLIGLLGSDTDCDKKVSLATIFHHTGYEWKEKDIFKILNKTITDDSFDYGYLSNRRSSYSGINGYLLCRYSQYKFNIQHNNHQLNIGRITQYDVALNNIRIVDERCRNTNLPDAFIGDDITGNKFQIIYENCAAEKGKQVYIGATPPYFMYTITCDNTLYSRYSFHEKQYFISKSYDKTNSMSILIGLYGKLDDRFFSQYYPGNYMIFDSRMRLTTEYYCADRLVNCFSKYIELNPRQKCLSYIKKGDSPYSMYSSLLLAYKNDYENTVGKVTLPVPPVRFNLTEKEADRYIHSCSVEWNYIQEFPEPTSGGITQHQKGESDKGIGAEGRFVTFEFDTYVDKNVIDLKFNPATAQYEATHPIDNDFIPPLLQGLTSLSLKDDYKNNYSLTTTEAGFLLFAGAKNYSINRENYKLKENQ